MTAQRRPDASMSLLNDLFERPLEPGYAAAVARRAAQGLPPTSTRSPLVVATAVALGFLLAVSGASLRSTTSVVTQTRDRLLTEIESRQQAGDAQAQTLAALQREVAAARAAALGSALPGVVADVARLELTGGYAAATGPGLLVQLNDAPGDNAAGTEARGGGGFDSGRVSATDLQIVVNGLWAAGAEAISVNGQRLTSHAAIRFAGEAILVDFRPLSPPYALNAIGDPNGLPAAFAATAAGGYLKALEDNYRIRVLIETSAGLTCPAAPLAALHYAQSVASGIPSGSTATATASSTPRATATPRASATTTTTRGGRP